MTIPDEMNHDYYWQLFTIHDYSWARKLAVLEKSGRTQIFNDKSIFDHVSKMFYINNPVFLFSSVYYTLYHGLALYTEVTFVNVTLVEAGTCGGGPAVV